MSWGCLCECVGYAVGYLLLAVGLAIYYIGLLIGYLIYYACKYTYLGIRWCGRKIYNYYKGNNAVAPRPRNRTGYNRIRNSNVPVNSNNYGNIRASTSNNSGWPVSPVNSNNYATTNTNNYGNFRASTINNSGWPVSPVNSNNYATTNTNNYGSGNATVTAISKRVIRVHASTSNNSDGVFNPGNSNNIAKINKNNKVRGNSTSKNRGRILASDDESRPINYNKKQTTVPSRDNCVTRIRNSDSAEFAPTHRKTRASRERSKSRDKSIPTSDVRMPTGRSVPVTTPAKPYCKCQQLCQSTLIPLWPKGKQGGLEYKIVYDEMCRTIGQHTSGNYSSYHIVKVHKVKNCCLWTRFWNRQGDISKENNGVVNQRMLFHGSGAVDDIVAKGFDERHSNKNGMFGAGVYFASHSSKSNQYAFGFMAGRKACPRHSIANCTYCERKMLLCRVTLGRTQNLTSVSASKMAHAPRGYHSVTGVPTSNGLRYPEYIIYRGEQAYPEYLITYRIKL